MSEAGTSAGIGHWRQGAAIPPATYPEPPMESRASTALRIAAAA